MLSDTWLKIRDFENAKKHAAANELINFMEKREVHEPGKELRKVRVYIQMYLTTPSGSHKSSV